MRKRNDSFLCILIFNIIGQYFNFPKTDSKKSKKKFQKKIQKKFQKKIKKIKNKNKNKFEF
jgi:hypothetical protein